MGKHALPEQKAESARVSWSLSRKLLAGFLLLSALATVLGLVRLWPGDEPVNIGPEFAATSGFATPRVSGTVAVREDGLCNSPSIGKAFDGNPLTALNRDGKTCPRAIIDITSGSNAGKRTLLMLNTGPSDPEVHQGDKVWLSETKNGLDVMYSFADFQRTTNLLWWLVATAVLIAIVGMHRGLLSLVGLALTMAMVCFFLLPALLRGGDPIALAVVGGSAVLFLALYTVHGFSWKTSSALAGTLIALALSALLARAAISNAQLRGLGNEDNLHILLYLPDVSIAGLMLCGFIIGALGVLNDVTVAQASTVHELATADPDASPMRNFAAAMRVGRDHIASMVYTLVLSYTGAALPSLLLLSVSGRPLMQILTSDIMATELLRSAVGALALVLAVPITTAIAAFTVRK